MLIIRSSGIDSVSRGSEMSFNRRLAPSVTDCFHVFNMNAITEMKNETKVSNSNSLTLNCEFKLRLLYPLDVVIRL